jgi:uncharacterized membrane protein
VLRFFRNAFIAGLLSFLPLGITIFLVKLLVDKVGSPVSRLFFHVFPQLIPSKTFMIFAINFISTLFILLLIAMVGCISRYFLGKFLIRVTEKIIDRLPFIRVLYNTSKQIVGTFSNGKRVLFQEVVLVEFPAKGSCAIGFVTGCAEGELGGFCEEDGLCVFVPTTPNPTSGFLIFVNRSRCKPLQMSVADAIKAIISGGALVPSATTEKSKEIFDEKP